MFLVLNDLVYLLDNSEMTYYQLQDQLEGAYQQEYTYRIQTPARTGLFSLLLSNIIFNDYSVFRAGSPNSQLKPLFLKLMGI